MLECPCCPESAENKEEEARKEEEKILSGVADVDDDYSALLLTETPQILLTLKEKTYPEIFPQEVLLNIDGTTFQRAEAEDILYRAFIVQDVSTDPIPARYTHADAGGGGDCLYKALLKVCTFSFFFLVGLIIS